MEVGTHLAFFTQHSIDPAVFMRLLRVFLFVAASVLMWLEPMLCGGRNRSFHRHLAVLFAIAAFYQYGIAKARMLVLITNPAALLDIDLLVFEIVYTIAAASLAGRLVYDLYRWKTYNTVKVQGECGECRKTFQP